MSYFQNSTISLIQSRVLSIWPKSVLKKASRFRSWNWKLTLTDLDRSKSPAFLKFCPVLVFREFSHLTGTIEWSFLQVPLRTWFFIYVFVKLGVLMAWEFSRKFELNLITDWSNSPFPTDLTSPFLQVPLRTWFLIYVFVKLGVLMAWEFSRKFELNLITEFLI
jgi:hypothetical protein